MKYSLSQGELARFCTKWGCRFKTRIMTTSKISQIEIGERRLFDIELTAITAAFMTRNPKITIYDVTGHKGYFDPADSSGIKVEPDNSPRGGYKGRNICGLVITDAFNKNGRRKDFVRQCRRANYPMTLTKLSLIERRLRRVSDIELISLSHLLKMSLRQLTYDNAAKKRCMKIFREKTRSEKERWGKSPK